MIKSGINLDTSCAHSGEMEHQNDLEPWFKIELHFRRSLSLNDIIEKQLIG